MSMSEDDVANALTGREAGLGADDQIEIGLQAMVDHDGIASMQQIYDAVEARLNGSHLSRQGRASLRRLINSAAVQAGYINPYDKAKPGWRITPDGRSFLAQLGTVTEDVVDVETQRLETVPANTVRGTAFERYILEMLKTMYPHYTWYHQGLHKQQERGLDLIGNRLGGNEREPRSIGVQVKFHAMRNAPTQMEWLKFLAGCFARRVDCSIFVTTGRLTSEQLREAGEASVIVVVGRDEVSRLAKVHGLRQFDLFDSLAGNEG
jgi:hypothetical protein